MRIRSRYTPLPQSYSDRSALYKRCPLQLPAGNRLSLVVAPTLPMTTEVPVFEIVPPSIAKEAALPRFSAMEPAKAGAATNTANIEKNVPLVDLGLDKMSDFTLRERAGAFTAPGSYILNSTRGGVGSYTSKNYRVLSPAEPWSVLIT